jgi:hypothetical protein
MKALDKREKQGADRKRRSVIAGTIVGVAIAAASLGFGHFHASGTPVAAVQKPSTCADTYKLAALRPSQITAANPVCLVQALKFSGELTGAVGQAFPVGIDDVGPTAMCSVPKRWGGFPQALLALTIGDKAYRLRIAVPGRSEHQAVTINNVANIVELASIVESGGDWNQAIGTLTLNADGITGTINASLVRDVAGAQPVHVTGQWACGAPLSQSAADPSVPCASFYALNQLQPADVARMKATGCNAQDLTFSGDLAGHVDHAVTDLQFSETSVLSRDNTCSQAYGEYLATLKFSIGDESFLLNLDLFSNPNPSVRPGQYPATYGDERPVAVLYLGSADPGNHGVFVDDRQVEWGSTGGTVTIAPDMKSGTIDAAFGGPPYQEFSTIHLSGSWRCAA